MENFMSERSLSQPVQFVSGIGPELAGLLARLGLVTVEDMLWNLPRDVLDLTHVSRVEDLQADEVQTVRGQVVDIDGRRLSAGRTLTTCLLDCDGAYLQASWFNQAWVRNRLVPGGTYLFSGKPKRRSGRWEMSHPRMQYLEEDDQAAHGGVLPRYGLTEGLKMHTIRRMMRTVVENYVDLLLERLPESFRSHFHLCTLPEAMRQVHLPQSMEEYAAARQRLIFEDLLEFEIGLALRKQRWQQKGQAPVLEATAKIDSRIRRRFPFKFTSGQNQAIGQVVQDLQRDIPMHRLLQADVGAGKTVIAIYAMLVAAAHGYQSVLMAPTEVLANQHWQTLNELLFDSQLNIQLLTSALTSAQRRDALARIRKGEIQLIVGTQAVIQQDVEFHKLGVAVIDEQHKFGVEQRAVFTSSKDSPHVLVMTATPIPRSLCMTMFGDLDITFIHDKPPGRQPVVTSRIRGRGAQQKAWQFITKQLQSGRQAYVVCPRIEVTDQEVAAPFEMPISAEAVYEQLSGNELRPFRVELLHGQMDREQKQQAMERFRNQETDVLVSTTVIEVGVDVPNATLMAIMQAERFGLSQLHQLRGRIGRGNYQGYCFLFSEADSEEALHRLGTLEQTNDGFKVAEADFELRGPGDVLGTRQHGAMPLRVANLVRDVEILEQARGAAFKLVESGRLHDLEYQALSQQVQTRFGRLLSLTPGG
ncbi:MAG: ATP-dependent DNA helicase RecG [Planctomycetaceae bacterium]|nr:ATP-dependent DNA helicase RecG [Planctomycetaceae bacterium]